MVVKVARESVGGEDFLNLSLWCEFRPLSRYEATIGVLAAAKRAAKDHQSNVEERIRKFKNETFEVSATGAMHGGLRTDYRVQCRGITICLRIDADGDGGLPNVMVHVGSAMLMSEGVERCYDLVKHLVQDCLGGKILRESISRVDFCVDLPGVDVADLAQLVIDRQFVSRLRGVRFWGDDKGWSGFGLGKGPIQLRCYCKAEELRAKDDAEKAAIVKKWRWGGVDFKKALRVEWQLRGKGLRSMRVGSEQHEVRTVVDWLKWRSAVLDYACTRSVRFVQGWRKGDSVHGERAESHPLWLYIADLFQEACGPPCPFSVARVTPADATSEQLVRMALGCLVKAAAQGRRPMKTILDVQDAASGLILDAVQLVGSVEVMRRVKQAQVAVGCRSGVDVEPWAEFIEYAKETE